MPLDLPIVWSGSRDARESMAPTFRLNIAPTEMESGLRFLDSRENQRSIQVGARNLVQENDTPPKVRPARGVSRMLFASMVLIVVVLCILIFALLFFCYRLNNSVNYFYVVAEPYVNELTERVMSIVRHVDNSSAALDHSMTAVEALATQSIPALIATVNKTTEMVARLDRVARNPVLKVSME